jgi:type II secretion system protein G
MISSRRNGFTLIDLMIVIVILGVLAAIVLPLVSHHVDQAALTSAESNLTAVEKSIELYWMKNNSYPATLDVLTFQTDEALILPDGYSFNYDEVTGVVTLVTP